MTDKPPEVLGDDVERIAREIALFHGGHVLASGGGESVTVASLRLGIGQTGWRDHIGEYVDRYWHEYKGAAEVELSIRREKDATIQSLNAQLAVVVGALREVDRWLLVCNSAVRYSDPGNLDGVMSALRPIRPLLASLPASALALADRVKELERERDGLWRRLLRLTPDGSEYYKGYPNCVIDPEAVVSFLERHHHSKLEMAKRHKAELEQAESQLTSALKKQLPDGCVAVCSAAENPLCIGRPKPHCPNDDCPIYNPAQQKAGEP